MILEGWFDPASVKIFEKEVTETWGLLIQNDTGAKAPESAFQVDTWLSKPPIMSLLSDDDVASETLVLSACTLAAMLSKYDIASPLVSAFILHTVLTDHLTLSQRRLPLVEFDEKLDDEVEKFLEQYADTATTILSDRSWVESMRDNEVDYDLVDAVDGRLFRIIIEILLKGMVKDSLPQLVQQEWKVAVALVESLSGKNISNTAPTESSKVAKVEQLPQRDDVGEISVMTFSNQVFDKHLASIDVKVEASLSSRMAALKMYRETTHWHNYRKPLNPKQAPEVKVSKWRNPLRTNQFYMAEMTSYAASLTGAKGKALEPETITVGAKKLLKEAEEIPVKPTKHEKPGKPGKLTKGEDAPVNAKKGGKKAAAGLTKAQQIIADNKEKKGGAEVDKAFSSWVGVMKTFDEIINDQDRYLKAKAYLDALDSNKAAHVEADINLYLLQSLLLRWSKYCKLDKKTEGYHSAALIWTVTRSICTSKAPISKDVATHVEKVCKLVSISDAMDGINSPSLDKKLSFTFQYPAVPNLGIGISQAEFQLLYCGPYMDRYLDARYDPRVSFTPDGWQRKVLDELDADNSVFVVAPTSAGKTFISFYAMEQVLRGDNDGVLVYVAPTKALVNQIAAEVQGRFSKKYPQAGKSVWAIHTRDYRVNNSTGCQILVTVPHVLQIMLLSSANAKAWAPRVRRIIFDEIHSIGQAEDGVVWEQLLLLAPCPIIALSATVGNPEQFSEWLQETQRASKHKLSMIQHSTRYSDLRKYLYQSPERFHFQGLGKSHGVGLGLDGLSGLTFFHPIASLIDKSRGIPDDLALEPRDCFLLWKAMTKLQKPGYEVPSSLDPAKSLPICIKKADIFKWEKELKKVLLKWMADEKSPFDQVIGELSPPKSASSANGQITKQIRANSSTLEDIEVDNESQNEEGAPPGVKVDPSSLKSTTLPLLFQLHQRQALPAILFNYDRSDCEDIGLDLLKQLKAGEDEFKKGKEWQRKLEGWTQWKEMKDKKSKKPIKASKKKGGDDDEKTSKADQARDDASGEVSSYDLFDPEEPQDNFSFADKRRCQQSELVETIRQLRRKYIPENLIQLLQRGIGVHHAGMNRKYRQCIEMLFRKGYLRVVVATGTLSLGINMPCATVVFSGDSVFLTALNFRQAAGRSGRRGFDLLGNVVFQGITTERASRLLSSRLPDITGHFPVTTTLVLRLLTLLHDSKNSPYAVKAINSLLSQPRLYLGGESVKDQVLHHLRFSIEYLRRQSLIGPAGEPVNWTSCVSHLYFTENSSFAFHGLCCPLLESNEC
jgi:superfamily II DNA or RNA helicase